jgi:hypothetical protein
VGRLVNMKIKDLIAELQRYGGDNEIGSVEIFMGKSASGGNATAYSPDAIDVQDNKNGTFALLFYKKDKPDELQTAFIDLMRVCENIDGREPIFVHGTAETVFDRAKEVLKQLTHQVTSPTA